MSEHTNHITETTTDITEADVSGTATARRTTKAARRTRRITAGMAGALALIALAAATAPGASAQEGTGKSTKGTTPPTHVNKAYTLAGAGLVQITEDYAGVVVDDKGTVINGGKAVTASGWCTAFSVSSDGYLVTAGHCVDPKEGIEGILSAAAEIEAKANRWTTAGRASTAEEIYKYGLTHWTTDPQLSVQVQLPDSAGNVRGESRDKTIGARVISFKSFTEEDVALLKVGAQNLPVLELGTDQDLREGDEVVSVGYASAAEGASDAGTPSFKDGRISSKRTDGGGKIPLLETSAALNPGMSGGPTLDSEGRVVGVNSAHMESAQAFNFVRPASLINEMLRREGVDTTLGESDVAFRAAIDAYNDGDYSMAVTKLDAVLVTWPGEARALQLRDDAKRAGGTSGGAAGGGAKGGAANGGDTAAGSVSGNVIVPPVTVAASNGAPIGLLVGGAAVLVLITAVAAALVGRRSAGSSAGSSAVVSAGPTSAVAPAPASAPASAPVGSWMAVDLERTDEIPVVAAPTSAPAPF